MIAKITDFETVDRYGEEAPSPSALNDIATHLSTTLESLHDEPLEGENFDPSND